MPRRSVLLFGGACLAVAAALAIVTMVVVTGQTRSEGALTVSETGQPLVGGPFQLVDQNGQPVDQTLLDGKWTLVFFGFTYCPDYCPTTLAAITATKQRMGARGRDLQVVFISVDPERDTPAAMKDYLSSDGFPEGVIGLTGSPQQIKAAAGAYRAFYEKVGQGDSYTMNHSLTVYLMGPDGKYRTAIAHDLAPDAAAGVISRAMSRG